MEFVCLLHALTSTLCSSSHGVFQLLIVPSTGRLFFLYQQCLWLRQNANQTSFLCETPTLVTLVGCQLQLCPTPRWILSKVLAFTHILSCLVSQTSVRGAVLPGAPVGPSSRRLGPSPGFCPLFLKYYIGCCEWPSSQDCALLSPLCSITSRDAPDPCSARWTRSGLSLPLPLIYASSEHEHWCQQGRQRSWHNLW